MISLPSIKQGWKDFPWTSNLIYYEHSLIIDMKSSISLGKASLIKGYVWPINNENSPKILKHLAKEVSVRLACAGLVCYSTCYKQLTLMGMFHPLNSFAVTRNHCPFFKVKFVFKFNQIFTIKKFLIIPNLCLCLRQLLSSKQFRAEQNLQNTFRGPIFSCVRPFCEQAVSDLDP